MLRKLTTFANRLSYALNAIVMAAAVFVFLGNAHFGYSFSVGTDELGTSPKERITASQVMADVPGMQPAKHLKGGR